VAGHRDGRSFSGLATVSRLCERAPGRRWLRECGVPPGRSFAHKASPAARGRTGAATTSRRAVRLADPEAAPGCRNHAPVARQKQVVLTQTRDIPALRYLTCACWDRHVARVKSLGCQSRRYGRYCGSRVETLAGCFRSCDGPRWWASVDLSPRQRDSAPATVLGSLQRCVPLRDHRKCVGNVKIGERSTPAFPKVRYRLRGSRM
jgi:hypothetical protein